MTVDSGEIVLAFTPSKKKRDYCLRADGSWFYEQLVRFYCTGCKEMKAFCRDHQRNVGKEPYYNLASKKIVDPPRIYVKSYEEANVSW